MTFFRKKKRQEPQVDRNRLPAHVAIIMDGNGRWAKQRGLPRTAGHAAGAETFRNIATFARELGLRYLTVYAFSTENWKRPQEEVGAIMGLLRKYLQEAIEEMARDQIKLEFFGDLTALDPELRDLCQRTREISKGYEGFQANVCLNYGGRDEIVRAARAWAADCTAGKCRAEELDEAQFAGYLYSGGIPDPELIIRPSGEIRTSNFLLWQSAYSEYYFTDVLWPDFSPSELLKAIASFQGRSRRFGGV
ncbi:MAG: isoprenyl transferase [Candidatus Onthomonas sp.]|nr:isoprenyl transferase [Candidatus Onthomonas sp.]